MKTTVTAREAKAQFSELLRQVVDEGETIAILQHDETVAFLIPRARVDAWVETMEVLGNPTAVDAIREHEAGKTKFHPLSALDEDES
jgi:prevent-host-death family protein